MFDPTAPRTLYTTTQTKHSGHGFPRPENYYPMMVCFCTILYCNAQHRDALGASRDEPCRKLPTSALCACLDFQKFRGLSATRGSIPPCARSPCLQKNGKEQWPGEHGTHQRMLLLVRAAAVFTVFQSLERNLPKAASDCTHRPGNSFPANYFRGRIPCIKNFFRHLP